MARCGGRPRLSRARRPIMTAMARLVEYFMPTEILLVSRGWIVDEVARVRDVDDAVRERWVDDLIAYAPPRHHGLRNNMIFWIGTLGATMVADAIGIRPWIGFVVALAAFWWIARELAVRTLRWRLDQLRRAANGGVGPFGRPSSGNA